jgi:hypothetical protein
VAVPDDLVTQFERLLGPISGGWSEDASGGRAPFQVVWFGGSPKSGLLTYATLGLSRHLLQSPSKTIRHELLITVSDKFQSDRLVSALSAVGGAAVSEHR